MSGNEYQASLHFHHRLENKVNRLEIEQVAQRNEIESLKTLYNDLCQPAEALMKGGRDVGVEPINGQSAAGLKQDLDMLSKETGEGYMVVHGVEKKNGTIPPDSNTSRSISRTNSVPSHLRGIADPENKFTLEPHHIRAGSSSSNPVMSPESDTNKNLSANNPLVTDGIVESPAPEPKVPIAAGKEPTPSQSIITSDHPDNPIPSIENLILNPVMDKNWTPQYLNTLAPLSLTDAGRIPSIDVMESFHPDFLSNTFGGEPWSPGLNFIPPGPGPCILQNRTYYAVDAHLEPYLPSAPGLHGAKLVPFFNGSLEDEYDLPLDFPSTSSNAPLFVMRKDNNGRLRYYYFGHYSQSRWSDKLDYDRMVQCVPQHVRNYWAEELSAAGRPEWITKQLLQHFFPKPTYEGRTLGFTVDEGGSVAEEDMHKREQKVLKDVYAYVERLYEWEKDARMRTAMIKRDFILAAFDRADADDPPGLRFWWEYLECISWRSDFYDMLVKMQARDGQYERY